MAHSPYVDTLPALYKSINPETQTLVEEHEKIVHELQIIYERIQRLESGILPRHTRLREIKEELKKFTTVVVIASDIDRAAANIVVETLSRMGKDAWVVLKDKDRINGRCDILERRLVSRLGISGETPC